MRRVRHPTYADRDKILLAMGYRGYEEYLASALWRGIRSRAWKLKGNVCTLCDGTARVLHHIAYGRAVLAGTCLKSLVPLCHECHERVEFDSKKRKRTLHATLRAYTRLLKEKRGERSKPLFCQGCRRRIFQGVYCRLCFAIFG